MNLDVDVQMRQGRFLLDAAFRSCDSALGIFGPSGSGKSTLFRALSGLARPVGGAIRLDGETLFDSSRGIFVPPHKRGIGLVFQDARLFPHWSVAKNLRAGEIGARRKAARSCRFDDVFDLLDIRGLVGRSVRQLSGGEQQRVALGRALLSAPRLLLMDEPTAGLDAALKEQIWPFVAQVHRALKIPTLLISHDLREILRLTDSLLLLDQGKVAGQGVIDRRAADALPLPALHGTELARMLSAPPCRANSFRRDPAGEDMPMRPRVAGASPVPTPSAPLVATAAAAAR
jgi:molybdate transport system ATP-binding protein